MVFCHVFINMELYDRYVTGCTSQLRLRDRHVNNKYLATLDLNLLSNSGICVNNEQCTSILCSANISQVRNNYSFGNCMVSILIKSMSNES